jgi:hypothetical protein
VEKEEKREEEEEEEQEEEAEGQEEEEEEEEEEDQFLLWCTCVPCNLLPLTFMGKWWVGEFQYAALMYCFQNKGFYVQ